MAQRRTPRGKVESLKQEAKIALASDDSENETTIEASPKASPVILLVNEDKNKRWQSFVQRLIFGWVMIFATCGIIFLGHFSISLLVFTIQFVSFYEIISICGSQYRNLQLPYWRMLNWYFVFCINYYLYGDTFGRFLFNAEWVQYHKFASYCLYAIGFMAFVLSLRSEHYKFQFKQFGWTHIALLLIVYQSHLIVQNLYAGLIWFLLPVILVICNDCMAYFFGFFFGRTPLILISPKKNVGGVYWRLCQYARYGCGCLVCFSPVRLLHLPYE